MNSIKFRLMFQSLMSSPRMLRSAQSIALVLVLAATSGSTVLAQSRPLTWQTALEQLFGRQKQKGGTRDQIGSFCAVTPIAFNGPRDNAPRLLLSDKPLIAWYGDITSIRLYDRTTKKEWTRSIQPVLAPVASLSTPAISTPAQNKLVLNQLQYDGEPLAPDREYDLSYKAETTNPKGVVTTSNLARIRFRTPSQTDRAFFALKLKNIALDATKTNVDPTLLQVQFLLQQNLVNDAQMLILQQTKPSPELKAAIDATQSPCQQKLAPKVQETPPLTPSSP